MQNQLDLDNGTLTLSTHVNPSAEIELLEDGVVLDEGSRMIAAAAFVMMILGS